MSDTKCLLINAKRLFGLNGIPNFKDVIASSPCVFTIGVVGDSGSGKTTFTNIIRHIFGDNLVSTITLDDYHLYDRDQRRVRNLTPLAPEANNLAGLERDIALLKNGKTIRKMRYNHDTGKIEGPFPFSPSKLLSSKGFIPFLHKGSGILSISRSSSILMKM